MKENTKWMILGAAIVIATLIYVVGTRYQAVANPHGMEPIIYDRWTGARK